MRNFDRIIHRLNKYGVLRLRTALSLLYDGKTFEKEVRIYEEKIEKLRKSQIQDLEEIICKVNNSKVTVSIVTPSFNGANFLPQLLHSLHKQTIAKEIEWIIVDDCSSDESMSFYNELSTDSTIGKICVFRNTSNLGAVLSLKRGISLSSTDIIAWVSADDFYVSDDKIEKDLNLLRTGADIVFSKYAFIGSNLSNSQKTAANNLSFNKYSNFLNISIANPFNGSSMVMKKNVYFECGGFNEFLVNCDGDFDLFIRAILLNKKITFSDTIVFNKEHTNQTSKNIWRMSIGTNITRLSYVRLLEKVGEIGFLNDELSRLSNLNKIILDLLFRYRYVWISEMLNTDVNRFKEYKQMLINLPDELRMFEKTIYNLSDEFMNTAVFQDFQNYYKNLSRRGER